MSQQRPRDILEFLRRASTTDDPVQESVEPTPRVEPESIPHVTVSQGDTPLMVFRRSQVIVAGVAAGLAVILAFLIGMASGGDAADPEESFGKVGVHTIRVIAYDDTEIGQIRAKTLKGQLEQLGWDEVMIERLDRDGKLLVTIGSWVSNPRTNQQAVALRDKVRGLRTQGSTKLQFEEAYFVRIKR